MSQPAERPLYPFAAIVGQPQMRLALLLHAVNPALGGVLVRGRKGTAKSTAVRSLAGLLPELESVAGCSYGCDPHDLAAACDDCRQRASAGDELSIVRRRVPVVELPIAATEDRVAGSLHLETAIQSGERRFEPGLLARANRGILYMDEVNLLPDHLVDLLLDAAAMGRNYVEREGISVSHPARVMLVGTMNPEEGELRPQLLDRFALAVEAEGLHDPSERALAVRNRISFETDPRSLVHAYAAAEAAECERLALARGLLPRVTMSAELLDLITHVCVSFDVDGLRADLAMYRAAVSLAAYRGRDTVNEEDIREVAPLVLAHRRRRQPFEQPGIEQQQLDDAIERYHAEQPGQQGNDPGGEDSASNPHKDSADNGPGAPPPPRPDANSRSADQPQTPGTGAQPVATDAGVRKQSAMAPRERLIAPADSIPRIEIPPSARKARREAAGRRLDSESGRRGSAGGAAAPRGPVRELALAATLLAAAPHQPGRSGRVPGSPAIVIRPGDVRERIRKGKSGNLVLFLVDASGSMGAKQRMASTKAAVLGLLLDAYRKRDRVGMVVFRGQSAELVLPPTNSVDLAERRLTALATGGRTPLAAGLELGRTVIERAGRDSRQLEPLLILVSDGRANSAAVGDDPWRAAQQQAGEIGRRGWRAVVLDTEEGRSGAGLARALAASLNATHIRLDRAYAVGGALGID